MKRSFEANTTLNVALFCVYMESFVSLHPLIEKGLGNSKSALKKYFLIINMLCMITAPKRERSQPYTTISCEMSQISEASLESLHLNSAKINREGCYQLTGGTKKRNTGNVGKLTKVVEAYEEPLAKQIPFSTLFQRDTYKGSWDG